MKNKFKLYATVAAIAGVAAPITTLASCKKSVAPIVIDEKEKTKDLPSGERIVDYTVTLSSAMGTDEMLLAELSDQESSQAGYKADVADVEFTPGQNTAKIKVQITTSTDEILKDGATFKFSINVKRQNAEQKEVASTKIEGFTIKYAAPVKEGLTIEESAKSAWSNPYAVEHTFVFDINPEKITVDSSCTFECDVTNKSTSTQGYSAEYVQTSYIASLNKLYVQFKLNQKGTYEETEHADFDFTLSCLKDGAELWRQSFTGFQIKYLYHQMYIHKEIQEKYWPFTYAGEDMFHIYILKNPIIKWGDPTIQPAIEFNLPNKLKVSGTVTEGKTEGYEYFDVPVKIIPDDANRDEIINFKASVGGYLEGVKRWKDFDLTIKYVANKLTPSKTSKSFIAKTSAKYDMTLSDSEGYPTKSVSISECKQTTGMDQMRVSCSTATIAGAIVQPIVAINPKTSYCSAAFNLTLDGKDANGNIIWQQRMHDFVANYADPILLDNTTITTGLGINYGYITYTLRDRVTDLAGTATNIAKTDDIDTLVIRLDTGKGFVVEMKPKTGKHFDYNTSAQFTLKMSGKYAFKEGDDPEAWDKEEAIRISYDGFLELDERTPAQAVTAPGFAQYSYVFNKYTDPNYAIKAEIEDVGGTSGYKLDSNFIVQEETATLETFIKSEDGQPVVDGAYREFYVKLSAYDGVEQVWSKRYTDPSDPLTAIKFKIQYAAGLVAQNKEVKTSIGSNLADMTLTNVSAPISQGDYYEFSLTDKATGGIDVELQQTKVTPSQDKFNLGLRLTKAMPFEEGDFAVFTLIAKRYTAAGALISQDKITGCKITYQAGSISWDENNWYVSELNGTSKQISADANVIFDLKAELQSEQTLYATVIPSETEHTDNVTVASTYTTKSKVTPSGKEVTIPVHLQTTKNFFTIADYCDYSVKFECQNKDGSIAWEKTIDDTTLAMFTEFTPQSYQATVQSVGYIQFDLTAWIPTDYIVSGQVLINPKITEITPTREGLSTHVMQQTFGVDNPTMTFHMPIDEQQEGQAQSGDKVKFNLGFDVIVKVGTRTLTFPFTFSDMFTLTKA